MAAGIRVEGADAIIKKLKELEPKLSKKIVRQAQRAAAKPLRLEAQSRAPVGETGNLKKAIKIKAGPRSRRAIMLDVLIGEGDFKGDTFYGAMQEWGWTTRGETKVEGKHFIGSTFQDLGESASKQVQTETWAGIKRSVEGK